jgi:pimeloyl-ACP methyl ester carboxylesterase
VNESAYSSTENQKYHIDRTAEYSGGTVVYSVIEGSTELNPVLVIPGFTGGRVALQKFAEELNSLGDREVIFSDQPVLDKTMKKDLSIVDYEARAVLAIIDAEGLKDTPLDVITHSFGAVIAVRAAELAKVRGIKSFDSSQGAHIVFVAPAGTNDKENLVSLGGRWVKFLAKDTFYKSQLDPTGEMSKAGLKNFWSDPAKTAKEILEIKKKDEIYAYLGSLGLQPFILGFANDSLYPHKVIGKVLEESGTQLSGYAVPIDNGVVGAANFSEFRKRSGLSVKEAKKAWAHHYRNANHADLQYHPERTVKAILEFINR